MRRIFCVGGSVRCVGMPAHDCHVMWHGGGGSVKREEDNRNLQSGSACHFCGLRNRGQPLTWDTERSHFTYILFFQCLSHIITHFVPCQWLTPSTSPGTTLGPLFPNVPYCRLLRHVSARLPPRKTNHTGKQRPDLSPGKQRPDLSQHFLPGHTVSDGCPLGLRS